MMCDSNRLFSETFGFPSLRPSKLLTFLVPQFLRSRALHSRFSTPKCLPLSMSPVASFSGSLAFFLEHKGSTFPITLEMLRRVCEHRENRGFLRGMCLCEGGRCLRRGAFRRYLGEGPGGSPKNRLVEAGSCHESGSVGSRMLENPQQ